MAIMFKEAPESEAKLLTSVYKVLASDFLSNVWEVVVLIEEARDPSLGREIS